MRALIVVLFTSWAGAYGALSPLYVSIDQQFAQSDVVAVGSCLTVGLRDPNQPAELNGRLVPQDYVATYSLVRLYKGSSSMKADVLFPQRNPEWGPPGCSKQAALVFLKRGPTEPYLVLEDSTFGIRYFPGQPPPANNTAGGLRQLESDCAGFVTSSDAATASVAITLLSDFDQLTEATISRLAGKKSIPDKNASVLRLEILARSNPDQYFDELIQHAPEALLADAAVSVRFCDTIEHSATAKRVESLETAVSGNAGANLPVRLCAMSAIRRLKAPRSVPFLIKTIEDTDLDIAYLAVITLADITDMSGDYGPGMQLFKKNPDKYRSLWRTWWQNGGSQQYRGSPSP